MVRNIDSLVASGKITAAEGARRKVQQRQSLGGKQRQKGNAPRGVGNSGGGEAVEVELMSGHEFKADHLTFAVDVFGASPAPLNQYKDVVLTSLRLQIKTSLGFDEGDARVAFGLNEAPAATKSFDLVVALAGSVVWAKPTATSKVSLALRPADRRVLRRNGAIVGDDIAGSLAFLASAEWIADNTQMMTVSLFGSFRCSNRIQGALGGKLVV